LWFLLLLVACSSANKQQLEFQHQLKEARSAAAESELLCETILKERLPAQVAIEHAKALDEDIGKKLKKLNEITSDQGAVSSLRSRLQQLSHDLNLLVESGATPEAARQLSNKFQQCGKSLDELRASQ
jgi:hypothetical protein